MTEEKWLTEEWAKEIAKMLLHYLVGIETCLENMDEKPAQVGASLQALKMGMKYKLEEMKRIPELREAMIKEAEWAKEQSEKGKLLTDTSYFG